MIFRKLSSANKEKKMNKEHALSCEIVAQTKNKMKVKKLHLTVFLGRLSVKKIAYLTTSNLY